MTSILLSLQKAPARPHRPGVGEGELVFGRRAGQRPHASAAPLPASDDAEADCLKESESAYPAIKFLLPQNLPGSRCQLNRDFRDRQPASCPPSSSTEGGWKCLKPVNLDLERERGGQCQQSVPGERGAELPPPRAWPVVSGAARQSVPRYGSDVRMTELVQGRIRLKPQSGSDTHSPSPALCCHGNAVQATPPGSRRQQLHDSGFFLTLRL